MTALERSWYQPYGWSWLLWPLSVLFALISAFRRLLFKTGVLKTSKLPVPVVVVGNISVGGTGKTPVTLWLCDYLRQQGWKPGIVSRGYGVTIKAPKLVDVQHDNPSTVGDEPYLLASRSGCPVVVCPDRVAAARYLLSQKDCNIIVSDDGLQHYALYRDLEIVLLDGSRGLGNGLLLPAGPLREGAWRLKNADLVLSNALPSSHTPYTFELQPARASALLDEQQKLLPGAAVTLVTGIGNPRRFTRSAAQMGYHTDKAHFFPDHHAFSADDLAGLTGPLLMTEKDAVKCRPFAKADWFYLPVSARIPQAAQDLLAAKLSQLWSRYGL
ncbi:MAG TPA: tetraacyldisaccharide 4'-kinase [Rheinheimera sp.]|uniref:tetraacyldisaccharide 4'-kinase n=1 Tax=Rheinheimera sp. TaxID=1869214 RepID=UPI000EDEFBDF|nr:tetraacyldisaccharide 4'-kinase [Rheinheimera sp.]HCU66877.1 tetraacyldisaccharide 4'-kinase [Rheinheimera sp.]